MKSLLWVDPRPSPRFSSWRSILFKRLCGVFAGWGWDALGSRVLMLLMTCKGIVYKCKCTRTCVCPYRLSQTPEWHMETIAVFLNGCQPVCVWSGGDSNCWCNPVRRFEVFSSFRWAPEQCRQTRLMVRSTSGIMLCGSMPRPAPLQVNQQSAHHKDDIPAHPQ